MHYKELKRARAELTAPGAAFETVEIAVRGQSIRAYKKAPRDLRAFWLATAVYADRDYLIYEDERLTYAEAHAQVRALAAWLARAGVKRGDRVAIAMRNYPEWLISYWACVSIGVAAVGFNAWWVHEELMHAIADAAPKIVICDGERYQRLTEQPGAIGDLPIVVTRAEANRAIAWCDVVGDAAAEFPHVEIDPDDDACIFYTSGTTGRPKGARLTHRNCSNNLMSALFAGQVQARAQLYATGKERPAPIVPASLITTPLFHVTANNSVAYPVTMQGGKLAMMYKWDPARALQIVERERIAQLSGVPMMARELITHPDFSKYDTSSLLYMGGGGAALQPDLVARIEKDGRGTRPHTGYGLTETAGIITSVNGDFFAGKPASCGLIMPAFEAKCVDEAGRDVPPGEVGELWVRGAHIFAGYLNCPEATAEAITDGWFHTGDVARIDEDDYVYLVDRKKDMILRGGENVYCAEVESALYRHSGVAECVAFGVADERLGEEVGVAIVPRAGHAVTASALRDEAARHIAKYKLPRYIWICSEALPRNANGKFLKRQIREMLPLDGAQ